MSDVDIKQNLADIKSQLPDGTELLAVSKGQSVDKIRVSLQAGHMLYGENKVQEAVAKFTDLRAEFADIELHLIGHLQSNKAQQAHEFFDCIQSLDREKLARRLAAIEAETGRCIRYFVQVNIGEESQKYGVMPRDAASFVEYCRNDLGLGIAGLMCIPPVAGDARLYFALLKKIAAQSDVSQLSMGMSADWQKALSIGTHYVRIGTGVFGDRS